MRVGLLTSARGRSPLHALLAAGGVEVVDDVSAGCDLALADGWRACARLLATEAERHVLYLDALPHRAMAPGDPERVAAAIALQLPLDLLVPEPWLQEAVAQLRPEARCLVVPPPVPSTSAASAPVVAVLDGNLAAIRAAFAGGATVIAAAADGVEGLVRHEVNGLVVDQDDDRGEPRARALLEHDPELLARLREGARQTAATFPDESAAAASLADALGKLLAEPHPAEAEWPSRVMGDALAQATVVREALATERRGGAQSRTRGPASRLESQLRRAATSMRRSGWPRG